MPKRFYLKHKGTATIISDKDFARKISSCCSLDYLESGKRKYIELDYTISLLLSGFFNIEKTTSACCTLINNENKTTVNITILAK